MKLKILEHNIRRYEEQSYYFLRVAFVYICVGVALAVRYELPGATVAAVLTGFTLVLSYGGDKYQWSIDSNITELSKKVEKLRIRKMLFIRIVLIIGSLVALTIDPLISLLIFYLINFLRS